jgi:diguanylate cyclase (GGDEF)-like protein/PAS domain S-box-containing protein
MPPVHTDRPSATSGLLPLAAALLRHASDVISVVDVTGVVRAQTGATRALLGRDWDELAGRPVADLVHPGDHTALAALLERPSGTVELRAAHRDGSWLDVETSATDLRADPDVAGVVVTMRDISRRKALEEQLRHRAFHDPLTQLPNRALFYDRVEHALRAADRDGRTVAVLFLDLDDFKLVNDHYGHAIGDELLRAVARRLRACVRSADTVARLGGDEFGILLPGVAERGEPVQVAQRILDALRRPYALAGDQVTSLPSVGIADSEGDEIVAEDVLRRADVAMYAAKRQGKGRFELYSAGRGEVAGPGDDGAVDPDDERLSFFLRIDEQREEILRRLALPEPVTPVFQPILDLRTGRIAGYEGLSRFPGDDPRPPNAWFAEAHRCGLGGRLEAAALRAMLAAGPPPGLATLSLNLTPSALAAADAREALPADLTGMTIEITENELVTQTETLERTLDDLRSRGARIAIDDAGAGYAGFKQLMRLRPDVIKLDRSLVSGVDSDPLKASLIESFVRFSRQLGALVCAEGVEELAELETLAALDVDLAQGYVIARPAPAWAEASPAASAVCAATLETALRGAERPREGTDAHFADVGAQLLRAEDPEALEAALPLVARLLPADEVFLSEVHPDAVVTLAGSSGSHDNGSVWPLADYPLTRRVLETGEPAQVLVSDPRADPAETEILRADGNGSLLMLPVCFRDRVVGLLEAYTREERPWSLAEIRRARLVADQVGVAMALRDLSAPA